MSSQKYVQHMEKSPLLENMYFPLFFVSTVFTHNNTPFYIHYIRTPQLHTKS